VDCIHCMTTTVVLRLRPIRMMAEEVRRGRKVSEYELVRGRLSPTIHGSCTGRRWGRCLGAPRWLPLFREVRIIVWHLTGKYLPIRSNSSE